MRCPSRTQNHQKYRETWFTITICERQSTMIKRKGLTLICWSIVILFTHMSQKWYYPNEEFIFIVSFWLKSTLRLHATVESILELSPTFRRDMKHHLDLIENIYEMIINRSVIIKFKIKNYHCQKIYNNIFTLIFPKQINRWFEPPFEENRSIILTNRLFLSHCRSRSSSEESSIWERFDGSNRLLTRKRDGSIGIQQNFFFKTFLKYK
jgi:hypothetical protein